MESFETIKCDDAVADLFRAFAGVEHDLWEGNTLFVAPFRFAFARRLKAKEPAGWSADDLDCVLFRAMTTMGGEDTFKFLLPRYVQAFLNDPRRGWMSESHVLLSKFERVDFDRWPVDQQRASAVAMLLVAERFIELHGDGDADDQRLAAWAQSALTVRE